MPISTLSAAQTLRDALHDYPARAPIGPVAYILNPLVYAWKNHAAYITRFAPDGHTVKAILLGMNPGPWGMAQSGIPFGTTSFVKNFLGLHEKVDTPLHTHPKRPILGLTCEKQEVSGMRLWSAIQSSFQTPENFFRDFFVVNYCPLAFQSESGANLTPDKVPSELWHTCRHASEAHLADVIRALKPEMVIGIGKWAEDQAKQVIARFSLSVKTGTILHPSPASPAANRGWAEQAHAQLKALGYPWPTF